MYTQLYLKFLFYKQVVKLYAATQVYSCVHHTNPKIYAHRGNLGSLSYNLMLFAC